MHACLDRTGLWAVGRRLELDRRGVSGGRPILIDRDSLADEAATAAAASSAGIAHQRSSVATTAARPLATRRRLCWEARSGLSPAGYTTRVLNNGAVTWACTVERRKARSAQLVEKTVHLRADAPELIRGGRRAKGLRRMPSVMVR